MIHDLARPVDALRTARRLTDGPMIVMDERTVEAFTAPADPTERFLYAASVLHCLPVGRIEQPSAATGTVMGADPGRFGALRASRRLARSTFYAMSRWQGRLERRQRCLAQSWTSARSCSR